MGHRKDFTFDSYRKRGQNSSSTDPRGRVTTYGYDNRNRLETTTDPKRASQPANPVTRFEYDVAGNKKKVTFPDNNAQQWDGTNVTDRIYKWGAYEEAQNGQNLPPEG